MPTREQSVRERGVRAGLARPRRDAHRGCAQTEENAARPDAAPRDPAARGSGCPDMRAGHLPADTGVLPTGWAPPLRAGTGLTDWQLKRIQLHTGHTRCPRPEEDRG